MISIAAVEEVTYRCRGSVVSRRNPLAFSVLALLTNGKDLSTGEIIKKRGSSKV